MRIREIYFHNVRAFRGEHRISFVDPLTDQVRPVTVIAGTNGTGKTTIFDTIEELLRFALDPRVGHHPLIDEIARTGFACLTLELDPSPLVEAGIANFPAPLLHLIAGRKDLAPESIEKVWPNAIFYIPDYPYHWHGSPAHVLQSQLTEEVHLMQDGEAILRGGLVYFPQTRQLFPQTPTPGGVQPEPPHREWISRVMPPNQWRGSLESMWVWQNYLDLEAYKEGSPTDHLKPFVETVEEVLGDERRVTIREGRVLVPVGWRQNGDEPAKVQLDQLPSGEQQCLLLFGELARRRRLDGVILVDEPETSLHPTLQRLVVYQLRKLARNWHSQLILATHSIEVLRAVHRLECINLDYLDAHTELAEMPVEVEA